MSSTEAALRALRTQVQFELARAASEVAAAAALSAGLQQQMVALRESCESMAEELRSAMGRSQVNPALLEAMHRLFQVEHHRLNHSRARLAQARQREQQAREVLAGERNRDRSLERALRAEHRKQRLRRQTLEMMEADDLWLQHAWRDLQ